MAPRTSATLTAEHIGTRIVLLRGHKVLLDTDLASLYGVSTGRLNEQVGRNLDRFPPDFMFRLSNQEVASRVRGADAALHRFLAPYGN